MNVDAGQWLREFASHRSEAAFAALVRAHVDLVYSAARRIAAWDTHLAEDITQTVFADLARKASRLPAGVILSGWLYRHTFFVASSMIRAERRRRAREQEVVAMNTVAEAPEPDWSRLAPHLDEAMNALAEADRLALVLRYFDRLDLRTVGERLGVGEDAAQKRVARALEKLKARFAKNGIQISLTTLAATLLANAVNAAPVALAAHVAAAVVSGAAVGSGILIAMEKFMTLNALKPIAAAIVVVGVTTPLFLQHQSLGALRDQNASLEAQSAELDELRAENERLAKLAVDYRELETLRAEHLELLRLRGDATLLRNQLDELKREFERQRQLLAAKGATADELLTGEEREARRQIMIEARFAEVSLSAPVWAEFGLRPPANATDEGGYRILEAEAADRLLKRLEETTGVNLLFAPRVSTANGRQSQIKSVEIQTIVTGKNGDRFITEPMEFGPTLDVIPTLARGGDTIQLKGIATATQFLGYDDPDDVKISAPDGTTDALPPGTPLPRFNFRQIQTDAQLAPGQVLVLTGGFGNQAPKSSSGERPAPAQTPSGLIILVTPREIAPTGEPAAGPGAFAPVAAEHPPAVDP